MFQISTIFHCLDHSKESVQFQGPGVTFCNKLVFYGEELLAPSQTPKLEDHPLLAAWNCLFSLFAATLHLEAILAVWNLRICHVTVTRTYITWNKFRHSTNTRHKHYLHFPNANLTRYKKVVYYTGIKLFSNLTSTIKGNLNHDIKNTEASIERLSLILLLSKLLSVGNSYEDNISLTFLCIM